MSGTSARARSAYPQLYSWTVIDRVGDPPQLGALGACEDRDRAVSWLSEALRDAPPSAYGVIHKVAVSLAEVGYWYGPPIITAKVDGQTGDVVLSETEASGGWGHPNGILPLLTRDGETRTARPAHDALSRIERCAQTFQCGKHPELADALGHDQQGHRILAAVVQAGITSREQLAQQGTADLIDVPRLGPVRIALIRERLTETGSSPR
jgi:hypothetical protein